MVAVAQGKVNMNSAYTVSETSNVNSRTISIL